MLFLQRRRRAGVCQFMRALTLVIALSTAAACKKPPQVGRLKRVTQVSIANDSPGYLPELELKPEGYFGFTNCEDTSAVLVDRDTGRVGYKFGKAGGTTDVCLVLYGDLAHELDRISFKLTVQPDTAHSPQSLATWVDPFVERLASAAVKTRGRVPKKCPALTGEIEFVDLGWIQHVASGAPLKDQGGAFLRSGTLGRLERPLDPELAKDLSYVIEKVPYIGLVDIAAGAPPAVRKGVTDFTGQPERLYVGGLVAGSAFVVETGSGRVLCQAPLAFQSSKQIEWSEQARPEGREALTPERAQYQLERDFKTQADAALTATAKRLSPGLKPQFLRRFRL